MEKWISVKEKLPSNDTAIFTEFLVVTKTHGGMLPEECYRNITLARFMSAQEADKHYPGNTAYWELNGNEQAIPFEVTYWMELPGLPEK